MAILVFMFVFSFIGGLISPYEQDKFFYADKTIRREFAAVIKNTEFRYSSADDSVFGLPAQAQAMLAIQQQKDGFTYRDNRFTLTKEAEDFYSVSVNGQVVGLAYKSVVSPSASDSHPVLRVHLSGPEGLSQRTVRRPSRRTARPTPWMKAAASWTAPPRWPMSAPTWCRL